MVPQCYMLVCPCVYGLQQYGRLDNSCFLFCNLKKITIDVTVVFEYDC